MIPHFNISQECKEKCKEKQPEAEAVNGGKILKHVKNE